MRSKRSKLVPKMTGLKRMNKYQGQNWRIPRVRMGTILPERIFCKLPYADSFTLDGQSAGAGTYQFRLGSVFDPNLTGTGHQPRGFDQYAALYSVYRVWAVSFHYRGTADAADTSNGLVLVGHTLSPISTPTITQPIDILESPYSSGYLKTRYKTLGSKNSGEITGQYVLGDKINLFNIQKAFYSDTWAMQVEAQYSSVASNASFPVYLVLFVMNLDNNSAVNPNITGMIKLTYHVEFASPAGLGIS